MPHFFRVFLLLLLCSICLNAAYAQRDSVLYPVSEGGKTGYMNASGTLVVDYMYHGGYLFKNGYAIVNNNIGRRAAIDVHGKVVVPFIYTELDYWPEQHWWVGQHYPDSIRIFRLDGSKDVYNGPGAFVLAYPELNRLIICSGYPRNSIWITRILDFTGRQIAEARGKGTTQFEAIGEYGPKGERNRNLRGLQLQRNDAYAITDLDGRILYDSVRGMGFSNGEMPIHGRNRAALIDTALQEIIPFSAGYVTIEPMRRTPYYYVKGKDGKCGVIDRQRREIVPFMLNGRLFQAREDLFEIYNSDEEQHYAVYNYAGELVVAGHRPIEINNVGSIHPDYPLPIQLGDTVYRLWKGRLIGKTYSFISNFGGEGYAVFSRGDVTGLLDSTGKEVLATHYEQLSLPVEGILAAGYFIKCPACEAYPCAQSIATENESWVAQFFYLDLSGKRIGKETYDYVMPFHSGQAQVSKNCKSFLINTSSEPINERDTYIYLSAFDHGVRIVQDSAKRNALMNKEGKIISPWVAGLPMKEGTTSSFYFFMDGRPVHNAIGSQMLPEVTAGLLIFQQETSYGLMDTLGHIVAPAIYSRIHFSSNHFLVSKGDGLDGLLDKKGQILLPAEYYDIHEGGGYFIIRKEKDGKQKVFIR